MTSDEEMMLACEEFKKKQTINDVLGKDIFNSINKDIMKTIEVYSTHVAVLYWNAAMDTVAGKLEDVCEYGLADDMRDLKK